MCIKHSELLGCNWAWNLLFNSPNGSWEGVVGAVRLGSPWGVCFWATFDPWLCTAVQPLLRCPCPLGVLGVLGVLVPWATPLLLGEVVLPLPGLPWQLSLLLWWALAELLVPGTVRAHLCSLTSSAVVTVSTSCQPSVGWLGWNFPYKSLWSFLWWIFILCCSCFVILGLCCWLCASGGRQGHSRGTSGISGDPQSSCQPWPSQPHSGPGECTRPWVGEEVPWQDLCSQALGSGAGDWY